LNEDSKEGVQKYSKLNGCIRGRYGKNVMKEIKQTLHNIESPRYEMLRGSTYENSEADI
jgi:hypothetical protein